MLCKKPWVSRRKLAPGLIALAKQMRAQGVTYRIIAMVIGCDRRRLERIMREK